MNEKTRKRLEAARAAGKSAMAVPKVRTLRLSTRMQQAAFLTALVQAGGIISRAAKLCGVNRENHSIWLREDETYRRRVDAAIEEANDEIEAEIVRRGQHGYDEPIVYKGKISVDPQTGKPLCVRRYDTTLLIFLAKARMPDKYRERIETETKGTLHVNHSGDVSLSVAAVRQSLLNDAEYLEFQRQRALRDDGQPGHVLAGDIERPLETRSTPGGA